MKNFGIGLALGVLGALICFVVFAFNAFGEPLAGYRMPGYEVFMAFGKVIGIGGVVTFWIILPVVRMIRRRRE